MKTNPLNIINNKEPKPKTNVLDSKVQKLAKYSLDAKALIEIGTVALDGAMLFGYAKYCRQNFRDIE